MYRLGDLHSRGIAALHFLNGQGIGYCLKNSIDKEPSSFQGMLTNSTKYCVKQFLLKKKRFPKRKKSV